MPTTRSALLLLALGGCGRIGFDPVCGVDAPCVSAVRVNGGAGYAPAPRLTIALDVTGDAPPFDVRITPAPCAFADDGWQPYAADATYPVVVEPIDEEKAICVWARDANAAVSPLAKGKILYETANLPVVEAFDVIALDATHMRVSWTVSDVEGLSKTPVDLEIETATTFSPLAAGLGAGGMRSSGSIDLDAPAGPYIVRATAIDRAGNRSVPAFSDVIGIANWSIYAGTADKGYGSSARSAAFLDNENTNSFFAVQPTTMDVLLWDRETGVLHVDGATGRIDKLFGIGSALLPDDGAFAADATIQFDPTIHVGPDGLFYVAVGTGAPETTSAVIYQIDPVTRHSKRYIGGGTAIDQTATASTVYVSKWAWTFDEDGALYFLASCTPGSAAPPLRARILKAARNPDGTAGAINIVAGNCAAGMPPPGPVDATTVPLGLFTLYFNIGSLAAFDHGRVVYATAYPGIASKVVDGQLYGSNLPLNDSAEVAYDARTGNVLVGTGPITAFVPNRTGTTETPAGIVVAQDGSGPCVQDGVPATDACSHVATSIQTTTDRLYFADGQALNESRTYRLRFIDSSGRVQTYAGSLPLSGAGLPRRLARGGFAGIAYKSPTAPNQTAFPAGLYFSDSQAMAVGRFDDATNLMSIEWGNQSGAPHTYTGGEAIGPDFSLGRPYSGGTMQPIAINDQGLPVLRYGLDEDRANLVSVDPSRHVIALQTAGLQAWETAPDGSDPAQLELWPYGGLNNLTMAGSTVFLLGGYGNISPTASVRSLDFAAHTTTRMMGTAPDMFSADTATPKNASLLGSCHDDQLYCFTQYDAASDRLYFSEGNRLRYLSTPRTPATSALVTLFTIPGVANVRNFAFRPDGTQLYYGDGDLRCHDISSGKAYCNDTVLGPAMPLALIRLGPDQLTWKDNNTLLISDYKGTILQFTPP